MKSSGRPYFEVKVCNVKILRPSKIGLRFAFIWLTFYILIHFLWKLDCEENLLYLYWLLPFFIFSVEMIIDVGLLRKRYKLFTPLRLFLSLFRPLIATFPFFFIILLLIDNPIGREFEFLSSHIPNIHRLFIAYLLDQNPIPSLGFIILIVFIFYKVRSRWFGTFCFTFIIPILVIAFFSTTYFQLIPNPLDTRKNYIQPNRYYSLEVIPYTEFSMPTYIDFRFPRKVRYLPRHDCLLVAFGSTLETKRGGLYLFDLKNKIIIPIITGFSVKGFDVTADEEHIYVADYSKDYCLYEIIINITNFNKVELLRINKLYDWGIAYDQPIDVMLLPNEKGIIIASDLSASLFHYDLATHKMQKIFSLKESKLGKRGAGGYKVVHNPEKGEFYYLPYSAKTSLIAFDDFKNNLLYSININREPLSEVIPLREEYLLAFSHLRKRAYLISLRNKELISEVKMPAAVRVAKNFGDLYATLSYGGRLDLYSSLPSKSPISSMRLGYGISQSMTTHDNALYIATKKYIIKIISKKPKS